MRVIVRKELKELLTPQTMVPIVAMSFIFAALGGMMGGIGEALEEKPVVAVVDQDGSALSGLAVDYVELNSKVVYNGSSTDEAQQAIEDREGLAVIVVRQGFQGDILSNRTGTLEVRWNMRGAGIADSISTASVEVLLAGVDQQISAVLVGTTGINASIALAPTARNDTTVFKGRVMEGVSPSTVANMLSGQSIVVPMIIMMLVTMAGGMVISSMGMEKETKTLETLLTMPVKRTSIVAGKLLGAALVGLIMATVYMVGFGFYMNSFTVPGLDPADYDLTLSAADYALVGASLFLALLAGLAISMLLGTFAENFKAAQSLTFPVVMLAMIPMFMTMFLDFDTMPAAGQTLVFVIPFSHPMMAVRALMLDQYALVLAGIAYMAVFDVAIIWVVAHIFKTDRLLTGRKRMRRGAMGKGARALLGRQRGPGTPPEG